MAKWKLTISSVPLIFAGLQFLPSGPRVNPPVDPAATVGAHVAVPPHIARILDRSCMDCHSNRTRWPWYSRVAPASWMLTADVNGARAAMNFSEWDPEIGPGMLEASCAAVQSGGMPKPQYLLLHPEARLSAAEKRQFCEWTRTEARALLRAMGP